MVIIRIPIKVIVAVRVPARIFFLMAPVLIKTIFPTVLTVHVTPFLVAAFFIVAGKLVPGLTYFISHPVKKSFVVILVAAVLVSVSAAAKRPVR